MRKLIVMAILIMVIVAAVLTIASQASLRNSDETIARADRKIEEAMRR